MGYKSHAQRKAVHAHRADGGKGHPDKKGSPAKMEKEKFLFGAAARRAARQFRRYFCGAQTARQDFDLEVDSEILC